MLRFSDDMAVNGHRGSPEETTVSPLPPSATCQLFVVWTDGSTTVRFPPRGALLLGRAATSDLCIPDASVSRQHARFHLGSVMEVEDLGSANGTRVDGVALVAGQRYPVHPGTVIELGSVRAVVHRVPPSGDAAREASAMRRVHDVVDRIAPSDISVILVGETGAGKEVLAHEIHRRSSRAAGPFLPLNCAALSETLLESELFGYERGAFTGAVVPKAGLLETATGGTILLDEVGEMPLATQAKLLRVIETRQVLRLGSVRPRSIDVRFLAATHRDLDVFVVMGRFREDLLFRLNGITVALPPLRDRTDEIPELVMALLGEARARAGKPSLTIASDAMHLLAAYRWPGNVRELRNVVERAVLLCEGEVILPPDIVFGRTGAPAPGRSNSVAPPASAPPPPASAPAPDEDYDGERARIVRALSECGGNQTAAAAQLGMTRRMLTYRIEKLGLPRPRPRG
jgi:transcriptional regulator with GAF, ATPase, and Fis domain